MSVLTKAVVTIILPVKDMARARDFYENKLGLEPKGFAADGNYLFACGGDADVVGRRDDADATNWAPVQINPFPNRPSGGRLLSQDDKR